MNVADRILRNGKSTAPAVLSQSGTVTYGELRRQVSHISQFLLDRGRAKGERVGLLAENGAFFVAAYLGIIRAGLVAVPLQTELTPQALAQIASDSGMRELLVSQRLVAKARALTTAAHIPFLIEVDLSNSSAPESGLIAEIDQAVDLAALMFTSGSTGSPKGVMITHRNIECNSLDILSYLGLSSEDRAMVVLPFHYCFGLSLLHTHLFAGASVVLNNSFRLFPEQMLQELQETKCTGFAGVPSTYQILLRKTRFLEMAFPKLKWFQQAGGKLPNPCIQQLLSAFPSVRFFLMYGQTEATARLSYLPPERVRDKLGSIGKGLPSTRLQVLKDDGTPVTPGSSETGEIVATGDNIARGYWNDPVETACFFRNGRLYTGDLARVDKDGFIFFVERERDIIKPGGNRVSAREVEDIIAEIPDVVEVAVVGAPHELMGEVIKAFVVLRPNAEITTEGIAAHCRKVLPAFKIPHAITCLSSMPHNAAGKILKSKLRELANRTGSYPVPRTTEFHCHVASSEIQPT